MGSLVCHSRPIDEMRGLLSTKKLQRFSRAQTTLCSSSSMSPPPPPPPPRAPSVSKRIQQTDAPVICLTKALMATAKRDVLSLAQGIVYWTPPPAALERAALALATDPSVHGYGPGEGHPPLRAALRSKLAARNGLDADGYDVMVVAGANQGFTNLATALVDETDRVVLFKPYYFNHMMAFQMLGGASNVVLGPCDPHTLHPDAAWLEQELARPDTAPPKMVVVVNPCNPSGVLLTKCEIDRISEACRKAGTWLVLDNTYEAFIREGRDHYCASGPHVIHLFSFSKAYGMMGWRLGYIAYPTADGGELGASLLKVQDTIPICPSALSQRIALEAMSPDGETYVSDKIRSLSDNRDAVLDALRPLGTLGQGVAGGEGAIYFFASLPEGFEEEGADVDVVTWLIRKHGVTIIPGSSCGSPGYVRVAYANLPPDRTREAAARLRAGLEELVQIGLRGVRGQLEEEYGPGPGGAAPAGVGAGAPAVVVQAVEGD